ncbi:MAG: acylphosphatase [Rhodothermales bacterium]|nr:acylphosphatase [Rhodothermales bacterium]
MPDAPDPARLSATVRGRVQGVGFRYFTRVRAERLGLVGFVRNEPDGTVTVVAEGNRPNLEGLLDALRSGPSAAVVQDVEAEWSDARGTFDGFGVAR